MLAVSSKFASALVVMSKLRILHLCGFIPKHQTKQLHPKVPKCMYEDGIPQYYYLAEKHKQNNVTYPTVVACQVIIVLFIRHLFNKEIKKQVPGARTTPDSETYNTLSSGTGY